MSFRIPFLARRRLTVVACGMLAFSNLVFAGQDSDTNTGGGLNVSVDLRHRVIVPQILYFRIGDTAAGVISKLRFNASPNGAGAGNNQSYGVGLPIPFGDGSLISADGGGSLAVQIEANIGDVILSYDLSDPDGLSDGNGNHIPFDEIQVLSADAAGLPAPVLSNAGAGGGVSVSIAGNLHGGRVIRRQTQWTYQYKNNEVVTAGTYSGRVRYTVSAP